MSWSPIGFAFAVDHPDRPMRRRQRQSPDHAEVPLRLNAGASGFQEGGIRVGGSEKARPVHRKAFRLQPPSCVVKLRRHKARHAVPHSEPPSSAFAHIRSFSEPPLRGRVDHFPVSTLPFPLGNDPLSEIPRRDRLAVDRRLSQGRF